MYVGALSEENGDDDEDSSPTQKNKTGRRKAGKKRKATGKSRKSGNGTFKSRRFQRNSANNGNDIDDDEDVSFIGIGTESQRRRGPEEDEDKVQATAEEVAAQDADEKAETDRLWADFLTSVDEEKEKRKKGQERTVEKVVMKVVDFAGEKISVQEKVKVSVSSNANNEITNNSQDAPSSSISTVALSDVSTNASSSTTTRVDDEPGPSSAMAETNGLTKPKPSRWGISILGNDPKTIGLNDLDKTGLSGLLKAFQNKKAAAAKRIGTLEKSKLDWEQYKRNQGLEEELTHHNKSRDT